VLEDDLREEMGKLPRDLADIYSMIYEQISESGPRSRSVAHKALKWLLCAERSLSTAEFLAAVCVDSEGIHTKISESQMLDICCNLIVLDTELDVFRFAHLSVREFLEGRGEYETAAAHAMAAERCLLVCLANSWFSDLTSDAMLANQTFENYAVLYWAAHCQMSGERLLSEGELGKMFRGFTEDFDIIPSYNEWTDLATFHLSQGPPLPYQLEKRVWQMVSSPADPIFAACIWGFRGVVQSSLSRNSDGLSKRNDGGDSCLYLASEHGHYWIVRDLIAKGVNVDAETGYYGNALQASIVKTRDKIFQLLLEKGADVNAQCGYYGNALQAASRHDQPKMVQQLLDSGAKINTQGGHWGTALQAAAYTGSKAIVQHLLNRGADIRMQGGRCGNALQAAAWGGHEEVVQVLLDRGADINSQGGMFGGALEAAFVGTNNHSFSLPSSNSELIGTQATSTAGCGKFVHTSLNFWCEGVYKPSALNCTGGATETALTRRVRLIHMLIDKGADTNARGGYYGNPLQAALARSFEEFAPMLLEKGADVNARGGQFGHPLQAAARYASPSTVQLLIDHGADVNAQGGYYGNALQAACHRGDEEIVLILLKQDANVNARGGTWGLPIRAATQKGHERVARMLVDWDARVTEIHSAGIGGANTP
jgi:ankyrin repeat protein